MGSGSCRTLVHCWRNNNILFCISLQTSQRLRPDYCECIVHPGSQADCSKNVCLRFAVISIWDFKWENPTICLDPNSSISPFESQARTPYSTAACQYDNLGLLWALPFRAKLSAARELATIVSTPTCLPLLLLLTQWEWESGSARPKITITVIWEEPHHPQPRNSPPRRSVRRINQKGWQDSNRKRGLQKFGILVPNTSWKDWIELWPKGMGSQFFSDRYYAYNLPCDVPQVFHGRPQAWGTRSQRRVQGSWIYVCAAIFRVLHWHINMYHRGNVCNCIVLEVNVIDRIAVGVYRRDRQVTFV